MWREEGEVALQGHSTQGERLMDAYRGSCPPAEPAWHGSMEITTPTGRTGAPESSAPGEAQCAGVCMGSHAQLSVSASTALSQGEARGEAVRRAGQALQCPTPQHHKSAACIWGCPLAGALTFHPDL